MSADLKTLFNSFSRRDCLDYIRHNDPNGFTTVDDETSLEDLREACLYIATL